MIFKESAGTLQEVAAEQKHLGAALGFAGVLHTWTRPDPAPAEGSMSSRR